MIVHWHLVGLQICTALCRAHQRYSHSGDVRSLDKELSLTRAVDSAVAIGACARVAVDQIRTHGVILARRRGALVEVN